MKVNAVVLAGAPNHSPLNEISSAEHEALVPVNGRPMISYVLDALHSIERIGRVVVVGPDDLRDVVDEDTALVTPQETLADNIRHGVEFLDEEHMVLLVTADIPLIHPAAIDDFLDRCADLPGELFYPIISQEANEKAYPGVMRTYVKLREGVFTGGNVVLISPEVVRSRQKMLHNAFAVRKKPWQLSKLLGVSFIVRFLLHRLSIADIERRVKVVFGIHGVAVVSPYPEVGIDVDKVSDWELAQRILRDQ